MIRFALALVSLAALTATFPAWSAAQTPCPKLQILPFERVGANESMDWLARGFAELMGLALGRACLEGIEPPKALPETLLQRKGGHDQLKPLARTGDAAPDYFLTGSWFVDGPEVVVEALLLRFSDERWMAVANWRGPVDEVLAVPAKLARTHLEQLGLSFDSSSLADIEREVPRGLSAAAAFLRGLAARDAGDLAEARARFLESLEAEPGFVRARREALRATLLLGREREAASFALKSARRLESADPPHALEFLWEASRIGPGAGAPAPRDLLERIDRLALEHEAATGETAVLQRRLLAQIAAHADGPAALEGPELLARTEDRWQLWAAEIESELEQRARLRGQRWVKRDGRWVASPVPEPTVAMWRVRALLDLARLHSESGRIEEAWERYRQILAEYDFLEQTGLFAADTSFYWGSGIRLEAHFMMLRHLKQSGRLVRDPVLHPRLNLVRAAEPFVRDFADTAPDARARVWSRRADGGHEYFDFAAPEGRQIDRVRIETRVPGAAWLDLDLPDPQGWPPQFSFSRRLEKRRLPRGESGKTYDLPSGTVFLSASVLWGPRWVRSFGDALAFPRKPSADQNDVAWLRMTFETSPTEPEPLPDKRDQYADGRIFAHYAGKWGWEEGKVVRAAQNPPAASGAPDFVGKTWLAFEAAGALLLVGEDGSRGPELPRQIAGGGPASGPRLVRTHEGGHALLWRHGRRAGEGEVWIAATRDFAHWGIPRRVMAASLPAKGRTGGDESASGPIVPVPGGYLMLLDAGQTRSSWDLAHWGPARTTFAANGPWKALVRTDNDRLWAVFTRDDDREVPAGGHPDPAFGFYRLGDGRTFEKHTAILVSTSLDGISWTEPGLLHRGAEPSGLWAFPVGRDRIAVAAGYGSLEFSVVVSGSGGSPVRVATPVRLPTNDTGAEFFIREGKVWCARVVHDFLAQESVVLLAGSGALLREIVNAGR